MPREYRDRTRIVHDILHAVNEDPGIATTRLLFVSNLSHERLVDYVAELKRKGFLEERGQESRRMYHLTALGAKFLAELRRIRTFMDDFGLGA